MPGAAIADRRVDFVLPLDRDRRGLDATLVGDERRGRVRDETSPTTSRRCWSTSRGTRGFDFTGYKRASLMRRVEQADARGRRRAAIDEYLDYLEVHPDEFAALFNTILINVTSSSATRRPGSCLRRGGPAAPARRASGRDEPIRVWSAGCASGEEAYTLAMLLAEALGDDAFRERVKIYATDVDEEALGAGAPGHLRREGRSRAVPAELCASATSSAGDDRYVFRKRPAPRGHLRPPRPGPGRADLARRPAGLPQHADVLQRRDPGADPRPLPLRARRRRASCSWARPRCCSRHAAAVRAGRPEAPHLPQAAGHATRDRLLAPVAARRPADDAAGGSATRALREAAFDAGPVAQIVVDRRGPSGRWPTSGPRPLFGLAPRRPRPAAPGPRALLPPGRAALAHRAGHARAPRRSTLERRRVARHGGEPRCFDVQVVAAARRRRRAARRQHHLRRRHALRTSSRTSSSTPTQELETAYEELQSTNEELETTNEELQSTIEELETTNEELQSTNEELETMNEELQSTNEELQTINDELRERTARPCQRQRLPRVASSAASRPASSWSTASCACRSGTSRPRTCGGCAPTRSRASTSSTSTSGCRSTSSRTRPRLPVRRLRGGFRGALGRQPARPGGRRARIPAAASELERGRRRDRPARCNAAGWAVIVRFCFRPVGTSRYIDCREDMTDMREERVDSLDRQIGRMRSQLASIEHERARRGTPDGRTESSEDLRMAIEELDVAEEELRLQHEELLGSGPSSRTSVAATRSCSSSPRTRTWSPTRWASCARRTEPRRTCSASAALLIKPLVTFVANDRPTCGPWSTRSVPPRRSTTGRFASCPGRVRRSRSRSARRPPATPATSWGHPWILRDMSARERSERALLALADRGRAILDAAPVGIFRLDRDGNIDVVNAAATQLLGRSAAELRGTPADRRVRRRDRPAAEVDGRRPRAPRARVRGATARAPGQWEYTEPAGGSQPISLGYALATAGRRPGASSGASSRSPTSPTAGELERDLRRRADRDALTGLAQPQRVRARAVARAGR